MLNEHDQDFLPRCRRLGHEVTFEYCRQESYGKPCRLILDCWWERFDVRTFLREHLPHEAAVQIENTAASEPSSKVLTLLELVQQARKRLACPNSDSGEPQALNLRR